MPLNVNGISIKRVNVIKDGITTPLKRLDVNGNNVWMAGNNVNYVCRGITYTEFVNYGEDCLSPKTFTPSLADAVFLGWRFFEDGTSVLQSLTMGDSPITLYAVFRYNDATLYSGIYLQACCDGYFSEQNSYPLKRIDNGAVFYVDGTKYEQAKVNFVQCNAQVGLFATAGGVYLNYGDKSFSIYQAGGSQDPYIAYSDNYDSRTGVATYTLADAANQTLNVDVSGIYYGISFYADSVIGIGRTVVG